MNGDDVTRVELRVDKKSLERNAPEGPGPIWGTIWISGPDFDFPAAQWWDLAVALTAELLDASHVIAETAAGSRSVRFFDGPHCVSISPRSPSVWDIELSSDNSGFRYGTRVSADAWLLSVRSAAQELVSSCDAKHWTDSDVERLRVLID
jgi:hypothetical protein